MSGHKIPTSIPFNLMKKCVEALPSMKLFFWEFFGTFRYLPGTIWIILFVTALTRTGWFPFLLFNADWMGRKIYGGMPNGGKNYNIGVRMGSRGLMLNSVVLVITSVIMEKLCQKWGAGFTWGLSNILMSLSFIAVPAIAAVQSNLNTDGSLPPDGIVIAALMVFAFLGIPLAITYCVQYALVSTGIEALGLGQGLSMGVLNLAIVIPQVIVSVGAGPSDQVFGGGNSLSLLQQFLHLLVGLYQSWLSLEQGLKNKGSIIEVLGLYK